MKTTPSESLLSALFTVCVAACFMSGCGGEPEPDEEVPDLSGSYVLSSQLIDNACNPTDFSLDFWDIFSFADDNGNGLPVFTAVFSQADNQLSATLSPSGCELVGDVGVGGIFYLYGSCDEAALHRQLRLSGTATEFGAGWDLTGTLIVEVDVMGADTATPDGEVDCTVESSLTGVGNTT